MKTAIFAAIFMMMVVGSLGGRITPWGDPDVFYPNSGRISTMNLYMTLDTKLPAGHVLRITLPFASAATISTIHCYTTTSVTKGTFSAATASLNTSTALLGTNRQTGLHNYVTFASDLTAATTYVVRITFTSSPTDIGLLGYIQLETMSPALSIMSTGSDQAIQYDLNNAFAPLHIFAAPGNVTGFVLTSDANSTVAGASSIRQITFVPSQNFFYWPIIQLSWDNANFAVTNLASIDTGVNSSVPTPLTVSTASAAGAGNYYAANTTLAWNIYHNAQLFTNQTVKYNFTTSNPSSTTTQTINFSIRIFHRWNFNLTDVSTSTGISVAAVSSSSSSSASTTISSYQILLSWGVDPAASTLTTQLKNIFQIYASTNTQPIYQAIRWVFGTSAALSSATYQVAVTLCNSSTTISGTAYANCDVLENSIVSNMTGASCWYSWGSLRQIICNATAVATSGNSIGGRVWYLGTTTPAGMVTAVTAFPTTFTDSTAGTITITVLNTTVATPVFSSVASTTLATAYANINYNYAPLVNINGNGPLAAIPATGNTQDGTTSGYTTLWSSADVANSLAQLGGTAPSKFNSYTGPAATPVSPMDGGIFGSATAGQKYHVALFTQGIMNPGAGIRGTYSGTTVAGATTALVGLPGIDIFLNPNLFANGGSSTTGTSAISSCWAHNLPIKYDTTPATTSAFTSTTGESVVLMSAHCFTSPVTTSNQQYLRLRQIWTSVSGTFSSVGTTTPAAMTPPIDTVGSATPKYLTYFWENGVSMISNYSGASLKADSNVCDFYGVMYTLTNVSSGSPTITLPLKTGSGTPTDIGELTSTMTGNLTYTVGTPFFWSQMVLGPYGPASNTAIYYYKYKSVFLSGVNGLATAPSTFTTNNLVQLIRIRGLLNTSSTDSSLYPSSGKVALFLSIPNTQTAWEPLGAVNFTNTAGTVNSYATATGSPLVGNGAVRCWNAGTLGNCLLDRYGRAQPAAMWAATTTFGVVGALDLYEIITSDAAYSGTNFSIAILVKAKVLAPSAYITFYYRLGFLSSSNSHYYLQSWDQQFDNSAATAAATGLVSGMNAAFPTNVTASSQYPSGTACTLPYNSSTTTAPAVRISTGTADLDNNVTSAVPLLINLGFASNPLVATTNKQGMVIWCAQWNFKQSSSFSFTATSVESSTLKDSCVAFDYLGNEATAVNWYCVYCPISTTGIATTGGSSINVTMNNFFDGPAINIYNQVYHAVANDNGMLVENSICATTIASNGTLWQPQALTASAVASSYNIAGQKVTVAFNAPSGLLTTMVDNIQLIGKYQINSTADSSFPYGTLDTSAVCRLVPTATSSDVSTFITCAAAISGGTLSISSIGTITSTATAWTLYIWGFIGNTSATGLPATTSFTMQTYKTNTSFIVDQSSSTNTSYITWTLANNTNTSFGAVGSYQRPIVGARGWFKIDVTFASRTWFYTDKVVLNLDAIMTSTVNNNSNVVKCRIYDGSSDTLWQGFQSCTLTTTTTPPTLTIIAMTALRTVYPIELALGSTVRVYLDNMVTVASLTNKTIWGSITFTGAAGSGSSSVLTKNTTNVDITSSTLTNQTFSSTQANITKWWSAANDFQDLVFSLTTTSAFTSAGRVTIVFPSYYNPGLTTRSSHPYCTINGVYTMCAVGTVSTTGTVVLAAGIRSLVVWGAPVSITANSSFVIRVSGISAPVASYTAETFYIQINTDNTESTSTISLCGPVTDAAYSAPSAAVVPLNVNWFTVGSTLTRTTTTFTWTFGLNTTGGIVNTTQAIQALFPEHWGLGWGEFVPTCTVYDFQNNSLVFASAQTIFGNLVQLNVSTQIPSGNVVTLSCQNVRAPNSDTTYRSQDITIRVVDMNGGTVYQRSAPGAHNVNFNLAFAKNTSLTYVGWATSTTSTSPGALTAGTYSLSVTATVASRSSRTFTITPSDGRFAFLSTAAPFYITTGALQNTTLLGCAGSVPIGLYVLTFAISDATAYVTPSAMWVGVNANAITIAPSSATLAAFYSSSSLSSTAPVYFDLTNYPPFSDITITPVAPTGNTNFTFTPASIRLTAAAPKNYFVFTSTSSANAVSAATYTFAVSGTNAASYAISSASVAVSLTTDSGTGSVNTPTVVVSADSTDQSLATSKIITFTLTQVTQATVHWVVTLQGQSITDATVIQSNAAALTAYNANSANQAQYSTNYIVTSTKTIVTIGNLFPNTGYTVSAVAVSNTNKSSTVATYTFVTSANTAVIQRLMFNYTTYPSQAQRQSLLCLLTQTLSVPAINIRGVNGDICGNTTAFYAASNSTGDLGVYFYPLQAATDTVMTATGLQTALNGTTANVLSSLNTTLSTGTTGIGWMNAYVDIANIRNVVPGISIPSSIPSSQLTTGSIYFTLTTANETGFLFVTLCSNSSTTPTAIAMKQAAANITTISGALSTQVFYYYPGSTSSYNFTGLSAATSYNVYVVASNNDPSFLQNFTSVTAISVTTPSTGSQTGAGQMGVIFSVMTVFASVISLMFF